MKSWIFILGSLIVFAHAGTEVDIVNYPQEENDWLDMLVDYLADFTGGLKDGDNSTEKVNNEDNSAGKDMEEMLWENSYSAGNVEDKKTAPVTTNHITRSHAGRPVAVSSRQLPTDNTLGRTNYVSLSQPLTDRTNSASFSLRLDRTSANMNSQLDRPLNILVEGNVGSGKSTLLNILARRQMVRVFPEPVESWQKVGDQNLLDDMYREPNRWTTAFQLYSTQTRLAAAVDAQESNKTVNLLERSLFSERYCFVQMLANSKVVTSGEFALLDRYFKTMTREGIYPKIDLIIYIKSDPSILIKRINSRGRQEETEIPPEFLINLHSMHEDWLIKKKFPVPAPVVVMDGNLDLASFTTVVNTWADSIDLY